MVDFTSLLIEEAEKERKKEHNETKETINYLEREILKSKADEVIKRIKCEENALKLSLTEACREEISRIYEEDSRIYFEIAEQLDRFG